MYSCGGKKVISFTNENITDNFKPLSLSRNIFDLKSGIFSVKGRIQKYSGQFSKNNFKIKANPALIDIDFKKLEINKKYYFGNTFLISVYKKNKSFEEIEKKEFNYKFKKADYIWDYLKYIGDMIKKDLRFLDLGINEFVDKNINIVGSKNKLYTGKNVKIYPGNVIDTTNGPVIIDEGTTVRSFSLIEGPAYIGKNCTIDDAKIRSDTYIGDVCKISGEIENSIILSYTNKHHHGFLGHSYLGSWVNLGANTTNSDLKNNYGEVRVFLNPEKKVNTKKIKIGAFIGDHVKTGIGTLLNTGSFLGFGSLIYGGGMFPKFVPSFSWASNSKWNQYRLEKFIDNEKHVMSRREIKMSENYERKIKKIFDKTKKERNWVDRIWRS
ncbi:MAG: hypothetical protein FXF47_03615 [Candidatus Mcinerneyibacterium aminivorans]|uniref:Glucose-1-phosphate thymidylyltransferase n=1 Tax=Candidatus Mcinerneyibacterium aminivorans TaxID=2703815 RepID=A0A5D0MD97_9BACT|nr:MAG: hypothetical protein FXF47_03615 [Candidatus Mcinerneyibacterium aminivorans]